MYNQSLLRRSKEIREAESFKVIRGYISVTDTSTFVSFFKKI